MSVKIFQIRKQRLHLTAGIGAMVLAFLSRNHKTWRNLFIGAAIIELTNAALGDNENQDVEAGSDQIVPENTRRNVIDQVLMRWEEYGPTDGMKVVFIHGFPTNPRLWRHVIPRVGAGMHCLAWEMVGYGWSLAEGLKKDISISGQVAYLKSWLRYMKIDKIILVGHDVGGGVVQQFVVDHPQMISGIVLADSVSHDNWPIPAVQFARRMAGIIQYLPHLLLRPFFIAAFYILGTYNKKMQMSSAELFWQPYARSIGPKSLAHQLKSLNKEHTLNLIEKLKKLNIPARVVWAVSDPLPLRSGEQLAEALKAPFLKIKAGGHLSPQDHPEVLAQAIKGVLIEIQEPV